jgi:hypothetical protein
MVFYIIAAAEKDKNPDKEQAATGDLKYVDEKVVITKIKSTKSFTD